MKDDTGILFVVGFVALMLGILAGFGIGVAKAHSVLPDWIDRESMLVSFEGKPYRMTECEYVEKKEAKP